MPDVQYNEQAGTANVIMFLFIKSPFGNSPPEGQIKRKGDGPLYTDDTVKRYVVRDKDGKELNCCADERVAQAYCDYYNEMESMRGCKIVIEKRREEET